MSIMTKIKRRLPSSVKRRFNSIRYGSLPLWKKRLYRLFHPPTIPENTDGQVLIHLGCGDQNDPRYINVDSVPWPHVHYVHDVTRLPMFPDNFADLIYASHVLEHTSYKFLVETLQEWRRVLKPGGMVRIALPDFDKILHIYEAEKHSIEMIEGPLMGGQNYPQNFHYSVYNREYLRRNLEKAGFKDVHEWDPATASDFTFDDWAGRLVYDRYPLSLNLEATK